MSYVYMASRFITLYGVQFDTAFDIWFAGLISFLVYTYCMSRESPFQLIPASNVILNIINDRSQLTDQAK